MKRMIIFFTLISPLIITACGYNSGVRSTESVSYLYFTGNPQGASVIVGDSPAFIVSEFGPKNKYQVSPGKHKIIIKKSGKIIVKREVLLGDGHSKEFYIP